jgi:CDP-4-dehydro-6-deoxyglucose reductase, E1
MRTEREIREEIFKKVVELQDLRSNQARFIPGETQINYAGRVYDEKEMISLVDASLDFWLTTGRYARQFEEDLAKFIGLRHCLLTNSGSSANLLAVSALTSPKLGEKRLKPGDEVITTACGFPTTLNPIIQNNLIPVFIDVELGTYNIRADRIEEAITDRTKAIFVPHTLGNPVDIDRILKLVKDYDLWFVEDNCDALGSRYRGKYTGSFGHISTCSFYPAHHITMGEGGAVLTDDSALKNIIASFRDWGRDCWCDPGCDNTCGKRFSWKLGALPEGYDHKYIYSHIGYNLKVTDMQAAIGVEQLKKLPNFIEKRKANFKALYDGLSSFGDYLVLPKKANEADPSWFGFPILVRENAPFTRNEIVAYLEKNKIATRMLFGGNLTKQPAYEGIKYRVLDTLENTDTVMNRLFWIGVYPGMTAHMVNYILLGFDTFIKECNQKELPGSVRSNRQIMETMHE